MERVFANDTIHIFNEDSIKLYDIWPTPTIIVSDGPYGIGGFKGDPHSEIGLDLWYEPHIAKWSIYATPQTTLWFWCTEQGWATVHHTFLKYGWEFKACHIWDKGLSHVAGNVNTATISHLPVVTEVCVQYVKRPIFIVDGKSSTMQEWLINEWKRTGLAFGKANEACGVVNAASRKYFDKGWLWYMPPADAFEKIVSYANKYGLPSGAPYFSIDGKHPLSKSDWEKQKPKFKCEFGITNVWQLAQLKSEERVKNGQKAAHLNQKPLLFLDRIINLSSDVNDVVWDPFAGLASTAISAYQNGRTCYCSEINKDVYNMAIERVLKIMKEDE